MAAIDEIQEIIRDRGSKLDRADFARIQILSVDIALEDSEQLSWIGEAVENIVNDPLYEGDIPPME